MYALGVDLGTTFTAAAVWRGGHAEVATLGSRSAAVPSVVLLREDETFLTGESANRRSLSEPHRVAREFKRRFGDTTPILLGGVPYSAEALMAKLLRWVVDEVITREGGDPSSVCVSHPANWGPYKTDLLRQATRLAGLEVPVTFTTEPEAAAVFYAQQQRIEPGAVVAVYDLGGGTFDAAVLRKTATGFEILGQPEGIERLGGIDFDAAVFGHVAKAIGDKFGELDEDDPATVAAVSRLREECVAAKEALSSDTDVSIPVLLPTVSTEIRLTRGELEAMVRPALYGSIEALKRAVRAAGVTPEELHSVLLVGGSSRMPIVAQLVGAELGRPVAVDAHPKHAVAIGAAFLAAAPLGASAAGPAPGGINPRGVASVTVHQPPVQPAGGRPSSAAAAAAAATAAANAPVSAAPTSPARPVPTVYGGSAPTSAPPAGQRVYGSPQRGAAAAPTSGAPAPTSGGPAPGVYGTPTGGRAAPPPSSPAPPVNRPVGQPPARPPSGAPSYAVGRAGGASYGNQPRTTLPPRAAHAEPPYGGGYPPAAAAPAAAPRRRGTRAWAVVAAIVVVVVAAAAGAAVAANRRGVSLIGLFTGAGPRTEQTQLPPDEQCSEAIRANPMWVCLTSARLDDRQFVVRYEASFGGKAPDNDNGFHLHIYGGDGTNPPASSMGAQAADHGIWYNEDKQPSTRAADGQNVTKAIGNATKVCARIADKDENLVKDVDGGFETGNCVTIQRA
jgi:actin-like ATPase involved in cell morphogenesis